MKNIYNSLTKMVENAGLKNVENYFVNPDVGKQSVQPTPPPPLTPIEKIEFTRIDSENKRKQADLALKQQELKSDNARLVLDFETRIKELELKYNAQIDSAKMRMEAELNKVVVNNATKSINQAQQATENFGQQIEGLDEQQRTSEAPTGDQPIEQG